MSNKEQFELRVSPRFERISLAIGLIALLASWLCYFQKYDSILYAYLIAFVFWTTITMGALFFVMIHHISSAKWSVVLRRLAESIMLVLPFMFFFFIPIAFDLFGSYYLYEWSDPKHIHTDHLLQKKSAFLNPSFFVLRTCGYFLLWTVLVVLLYHLSLRQDKEDDQVSLLTKMKVVSAPGLLIFALTLTFAAFDWLMSLDAHWFSTIFGVYIFAGSFLAFLSFLSVVLLLLQRSNILNNFVTVEHRHDLGKYMFAFTIFWAYIAFCQYFLIWYGNLPEETMWYQKRWVNNWKVVSLVIFFGHFVLPFLILLMRPMKRHKGILLGIGLWILLMHYIELLWIVVPNFQNDFHMNHFPLYCLPLLGIGGIVVAIFWRFFTRNPIVPVKDPFLQQSIDFVNFSP